MPTRRLPKTTPSGTHKKAGLPDRLQTAAAAKRALLERFLARPSPDDPAAKERQAALKAVSDARDARRMERQAAHEAEASHRAAEVAAQAAEQAAREAEEKRLAAEAAAQDAVLAADRKARRDARYAARKARR
jgi:hypothetical protein